MSDEPNCESCPHERVHKVEYAALNDRLNDVRDRVQRLEQTLTRGVLLLVANLAGVVVSLARQFLTS